MTEQNKQYTAAPFGGVALYGLREAADHAGVSHQTIKRWMEIGLPHSVKRFGKTTVTEFDSLALDHFKATINHAPGRPRKGGDQP